MDAIVAVFALVAVLVLDYAVKSSLEATVVLRFWMQEVPLFSKTWRKTKSSLWIQEVWLALKKLWISESSGMDDCLAVALVAVVEKVAVQPPSKVLEEFTCSRWVLVDSRLLSHKQSSETKAVLMCRYCCRGVFGIAGWCIIRFLNLTHSFIFCLR